MKTLVLLSHLLLGMIGSYHCTSQIQLPFADTTGAWVMTDVSYGSPWDPDYWQSYRHFVGGDTTIFGKQYRELRSGDVDLSNFSTTAVLGHFRVDSLKVYYRDLDTTYPSQYGCYLDTGDILLYDFGMEPGDTFYLATIGGIPTSIILDSIDSVDYNGTYYRRFNFDTYLYYTHEFSYYWVEGIGSVEGFFPFFYYFESGHYFRCFHENAEDFEFEIGTANDCFSVTIGISEVDKAPKQIAKTFDITGREVPFSPNTLLIYVYSDGTTQKVYRIE
jgi:hypothetical protein